MMTNRGLVAFALLPGALLAEIVSIDFSVSDYEGNPLSDVKIDYYTDGKLMVARGSGTGEYVEVNMSLRMAAELKSGRRPRGTRLAAMVVFV